jgi:hypothetical protein
MISRKIQSSLMAVLLVGLMGMIATGEEPATRPSTTQPAPVNTPQVDPSIPDFMLGLKDGPVTTRYGGRRGEGGDAGFITLIAPAQGGVSAEKDPGIYYFFSAPTAKTVEIAITKDGDVDPTFETSIPGLSSGLHRVDLTAAGKALMPGGIYEVVVAVVIDPDHRSHDQVCSTIIEYRPLSSGAEAQVAAVPQPSPRQAIAYLSEGCWYDGFDSISKAIEADPGNTQLHEWRWKLLNHPAVKLPEVAVIDLPSGK